MKRSKKESVIGDDMPPETAMAIRSIFVRTWQQVFTFLVFKGMVMDGTLMMPMFQAYLVCRYNDSAAGRCLGDHGLPYRMVEARKLVDPVPVKKTP